MPGGTASHAEDAPDDAALMSSIAAGDAGALQRLYDRYSNLVFTLCYRMLKDRTEAEDVLVDVFFEIWDKNQRYDESRGNPLSYLMMVARSRALDRRRRRSKLPTLPLGEEHSAAAAAETDAGTDRASPLGDALDAERREIVRRTLEQLDEPERQAIECAYYEGLSHSEIAQKLNRPLGTVKTFIRRGLSQLRDALSQLSESQVKSS